MGGGGVEEEGKLGVGGGRASGLSSEGSSRCTQAATSNGCPGGPPPALQTAVPRHAPPRPPAAGSEGRAMTGTRWGGL